MKILISNVAIKDTPTGSFSRSFNLAKGLAKNGNEVTFLTTQNKEFIFPFTKEIREGVIIIAVPSFFGYKIKKFGYDLTPVLLKSLYVFFRKYDIVHSDLHRPTSLFPCLIHRLFHRSKLVSDWQDIVGPSGTFKNKSKYWKLTIGPFDNWLELYSKKISDGVISLSEVLKKKSIELGIKENKVFKLWGGSDLDKIKFYNSPITNRNLFNISVNEFIIVFVGLNQTDYEDNIDVFRAIQKIRNDGFKIQVVRTGKYFNNDFRKKHRIGDEILDVGYIDDNYYGKLLSCADACMLMQEPKNINNIARWPNVVGDYIAAGRPIIMNLMGELFELQKKIPEAIIQMESKDEKYLINRFAEIYKSRDKLKGTYDIIFRYAELDFSWDIRAKELENIYLYLLKND